MSTAIAPQAPNMPVNFPLSHADRPTVWDPLNGFRFFNYIFTDYRHKTETQTDPTAESHGERVVRDWAKVVEIAFDWITVVDAYSYLIAPGLAHVAKAMVKACRVFIDFLRTFQFIPLALSYTKAIVSTVYETMVRAPFQVVFGDKKVRDLLPNRNPLSYLTLENGYYAFSELGKFADKFSSVLTVAKLASVVVSEALLDLPAKIVKFSAMIIENIHKGLDQCEVCWDPMRKVDTKGQINGLDKEDAVFLAGLRGISHFSMSVFGVLILTTLLKVTTVAYGVLMFGMIPSVVTTAATTIGVITLFGTIGIFARLYATYYETRVRESMLKYASEAQPKVGV